MRVSRIVGIDVARGIAIIGMFAAHTVPRPSASELLVDGRPSILFATLAGVSIGLLTGGDAPRQSGRVTALRGIAIRALVLFLIGVALSILPSGIAVILDYYGVMFLLMLPAVFLPRAALALLAVAIAIVAPLLASAAESTVSTGWAGLAAEYLLIGRYPAFVWLPFLLVGLLCARSDLRSPKTQRWMVGAGTIAMVVGYAAAFVLPGVSAEAHSGSTAELVGSGGFAIAVIGVLLRLAQRPGFAAALSPVAAAGSMPLTSYTLQVLVLAGCSWLAGTVAGTVDWVPEYPGWPLLIGLTIASLLFAMVWRRFFGAGPLERLLRLVAGFDRGASKRRSNSSAGRR